MTKGQIRLYKAQIISEREVVRESEREEGKNKQVGDGWMDVLSSGLTTAC